MSYDETQIEYWTRREREEREIAIGANAEANAAHARLANSYAALIAQTLELARGDPHTPRRF